MPDPVWTLWFRPGKGHPWEAVFAGPATQSCTDACADDRTRKNGEWVTCEGTRPPTNTNHCIPRRVGTLPT